MTTGTCEVSQIGVGSELERGLADRRDGPDTRARTDHIEPTEPLQRGRSGSGVRVRAREILLMADTEPIGVGVEVTDQQVHASVLRSRRYGAPDPARRVGRRARVCPPDSFRPRRLRDPRVADEARGETATDAPCTSRNAER